MRNPTLLPYKVLVSALYHRYKWTSETATGAYMFNVRKWCNALDMKATVLRDAGYKLVEWGLLEEWEWHHTYCIVRPVNPIIYQKHEIMEAEHGN